MEKISGVPSTKRGQLTNLAGLSSSTASLCASPAKSGVPSTKSGVPSTKKWGAEYAYRTSNTSFYKFSFQVTASLSSCGNLGKRKKGKNLPVKVAKTRLHPKMMSFLKDKTMKAGGFEMLSRKVPVQSRPSFLCLRVKIAPSERGFFGRGNGRGRKELQKRIFGPESGCGMAGWNGQARERRFPGIAQ